MNSSQIHQHLHGILKNIQNDLTLKFSFPFDRQINSNNSTDIKPNFIQSSNTNAKPETKFKSPISQNKQTRKQFIHPGHHLFFLPLKSKNSKNKIFFLYSFPFICIYMNDSNYPEFEIISPSTEIFIEDRVLTLNEDSSIKKFLIKLEKQKIENVLNNDEDSNLAHYIKCQSIINELEPCFLINQFYYPNIFNSHYLLAFSECQIYDEYFIELWLIASEYLFQPLFGRLIENHFQQSEELFEQENFLKFASIAIFRNDQEFEYFIDYILSQKSVSFDSYLKELSKLPFSQYSHLLLHFVYKSAFELYQQQAYKVVSQFLFSTAILPNLKYSDNSKRLEYLHKFNHAGASIEQLEKLESILYRFRLYPDDFDQPEFDVSHFNAFLDLEKQYRINTPNFIEAARKTQLIAI